jgi:hypothetical protein
MLAKPEMFVPGGASGGKLKMTPEEEHGRQAALRVLEALEERKQWSLADDADDFIDDGAFPPTSDLYVQAYPALWGTKERSFDSPMDSDDLGELLIRQGPIALPFGHVHTQTTPSGAPTLDESDSNSESDSDSEPQPKPQPPPQARRGRGRGRGRERGSGRRLTIPRTGPNAPKTILGPSRGL